MVLVKKTGFFCLKKRVQNKQFFYATLVTAQKVKYCENFRIYFCVIVDFVNNLHVFTNFMLIIIKFFTKKKSSKVVKFT